MPSTWLAAVMGIVEGITEFLPVSSTGHLILAGHLAGFTGPVADTFEIFIQLGAILAVVAAYPRRFIDLLPLRRDPTGFQGWRGLVLLALTTLPPMVLGLALHATIKAHLFTPATVALGLAVGGAGILVVERWRPQVRKASLDQLTWRDALLVGLFQCLALWPGMSRASSTILGGMLLGLDRRVAAEYSFFAAVPLIAAAVGYDLLKSLDELQAAHVLFFAVGFAVSFACAWLAVKLFIRFLGHHTLVPFGWYRIALAGVIFALLR